MEASEGTPTPQAYAFSVDDFKTYPAEILPYEFPDRVSRGNFVNWFIQGFSVGRSNIDAHVLWMKYVKLKTGFDAYKSLISFEDAGGISGGALSLDEQIKFKEAFNSVKTHGLEKVDLDKHFKQNHIMLLDIFTGSQDDLIPGWKKLDEKTFLKKLTGVVNSRRSK